MGEPPKERRGRKLTPGERFLNWVDGVVKLWPIVLPLIGGTVYGNVPMVKETVNGFFGKGPVTVDDEKVEIVDGGFEAQVRQAVIDLNTQNQKRIATEIRLRGLIDELKAEVSNAETRAESRSNSADDEQNRRLDRLEELVN